MRCSPVALVPNIHDEIPLTNHLGTENLREVSSGNLDVLSKGRLVSRI
jgi:hypothetical protein